MANKPKDPFAGKTGVMQTGSASDVLTYAKPGTVIAFLPDVTQAQVNQAKAAGATVVIWQPDWATSAKTVTAANLNGVDGVVVQIEGPSQESNLTNTQAGLQGTDMPVWIVTNNYSSSYPPGIDGVLYESYPGTNPQGTVDSTASDVTNRGWTGPAYPVIGGDALMPDESGQVAAAAARGGYLVFPPHVGNTNETSSLMKIPNNSTSAGSSTSSTTPVASNVTTWTPTSAAQRHPTGNETIDSYGVILATRPGADGDTVFQMSSGVYLVGSVSENDGLVSLGGTWGDGKGGGVAQNGIGNTGSSVPTVASTGTPSTSTTANAQNWTPATAAQHAQGTGNSVIDSYGTVLATRPGKNGDTIFQMSDGTYLVGTVGGNVSVAGTWGDGKGGGVAQNGIGNTGGSVPTVASTGTPNTSSTASSSGTPAWHTNPNWAAPSSDLMTQIKTQNPNILSNGQVLESRPAEDGSGALILRMSDGSYMRYNPQTGATAVAGNWNSSQWNNGNFSSTGTTAIDQNTGSSSMNNTLHTGGTPKDSGSSFKSRAQAGEFAPGVTTGGSAGDYNPDTGIGALISDSAPPATGADTGCFTAGSKVSTPDGDKAIEEIKLGDMVNTYNMETKAVEPTQVTDTLAHHDRHTLEIEVEDGRKLVTTVEHPLWTGSEWVPAGIIRVGSDSLFDKDGKTQKVVAVKVAPKANVYNFHVTAPAHNYFVEGLLVHNLKASGM